MDLVIRPMYHHQHNKYDEKEIRNGPENSLKHGGRPAISSVDT